MTKLLALIPLAACAHAPAPKTPKLEPPIDSLAFYVGTWRCHGTSYATADTPQQTWDAIVKVTPELDGTWLGVEMIGPGVNRTVEHKGYDPDTKRWIHVAVGNGGLFALVTSHGWTGNHMDFVPEPDDHTKTTFTKLDDTHYNHAVSSADGRKIWEKTCAKS
ncbi:MAG TPA: DUF1579 family protein [Kofleriaceae bacterium]|nr:DUF1579 family protein [Kofleriaceae bacterium]